VKPKFTDFPLKRNTPTQEVTGETNPTSSAESTATYYSHSCNDCEYYFTYLNMTIESQKVYNATWAHYLDEMKTFKEQGNVRKLKQ
jgi:hypothetical protein